MAGLWWTEHRGEAPEMVGRQRPDVLAYLPTLIAACLLGASQQAPFDQCLLESDSAMHRRRPLGNEGANAHGSEAPIAEHLCRSHGED